MENILRIEAKETIPLSTKPETLVGFLISSLILFGFIFTLSLYHGHEIITAAKEALPISIGIMVGSGINYLAHINIKRHKHIILIDGQWLYLNLGSTPLWQVRLVNLVNISIDREYPVRSLRLHKPAMVRLKGVYDTYSFSVDLFDKSAIDLMVQTIQKHNPSFHLVS